MSVQVISGGRGWGKTSYIIEWLKENQSRVMLVHSNQYRESLRKEHPKQAKQIHSVEDYVDHKLYGYMKPHTEVAVDNLELVIKDLLGCNVTTVTVTPTVTGVVK